MSCLVTTLGDVCHFVRGPFGGSLKKDSFVDDGYAVYEQQHAIYNQFDDIRYFVSSKKFEEMKRFELNSGDLVMSCSGTMGRIAIVPKNIKRGIINQALLKLTPKPELDASFLKYWIESESFQSKLNDNTHGAAIKNVASVAVLKDLSIPLLPISEQRRIAAILDQASALRAKRGEALAELDNLTQAIFIEMFGDPRENEKKWSKQPIKAIVSDMRGGAPLEPDDFIECGFPILHKGAIKPQGQIHLDTKKKTFVAIEYATSKPRCIANREFVAVTLRDLVPSGPSIGLVADLRNGPFDEYVLAQGAYAFRIDTAQVTTDYFVHLSNMPTFRYVLLQNAVGSTQIHIRTPIYLAIKVPLPPIELQRKFSQRVNAVEKLRMHYQASLLELESLFTSLQHRAFRGEL